MLFTKTVIERSTLVLRRDLDPRLHTADTKRRTHIRVQAKRERTIIMKYVY